MTFVKIAISVALLWLLFSHIDAGAVWAQVAHADYGLLLASCAVLLVLAVIQAYRWTVVLRAIGGRLAMRPAWLTVMIGLFFNQTLPSTIGGDAVRIWRAHRLGLDLRRAINGVMIDRLAALLALLLFVLASLPWLHALMGDGAAFWIVPAVIGAGLAACAALLILDRLPSAFLRWRFVAGFARFSADARRTLFDRGYGPTVIALSLFLQLSTSSTVWLIARALRLDVGWFDCVVLVPPVMLVSTVPVSIAGWGVREGAMVTAFGLVGLGAPDALALSIVLGLVVSLVGAPGGVIWALTRPKRAAVADTDAPVTPEAGRPGG